MVRCFIGITIPEALKVSIVSLQSRLKALPMVCKMVEPENLHISLSFLGEVSEEEIEKISEKLDSICSGHEKFDVKIAGLNPIPSESYIRVLALGIEDAKCLEKISGEIKKKVGGDVKPPHLTLCRVRGIKSKEAVLAKIREMKDVTIGTFTISSIKLIKSKLQRTGPIYTTLHRGVLT